MSPDGKSLYTAVGTAASAIWLHDGSGDRQITTQGYAFLPILSPDGHKVYFLLRGGKSRSYVQGQLWVADLASGRSERLFPDFVMAHYAISPDGKKVVFATASDAPGAGIWIADLARQAAPKQLTSGGEYRVFFGAPGELIAQVRTDEWHLFRMKEDGSSREQISPDPILHLNSVSPDGKWAIVSAATANNQLNSIIEVYSLHGEGGTTTLCDTCVAGFGPARTGAPLLSWSADGKTMFVSLQYFGLRSRNTLLLPTRPGARPPNPHQRKNAQR